MKNDRLKARAAGAVLAGLVFLGLISGLQHPVAKIGMLATAVLVIFTFVPLIKRCYLFCMLIFYGAFFLAACGIAEAIASGGDLGGPIFLILATAPALLFKRDRPLHEVLFEGPPWDTKNDGIRIGNYIYIDGAWVELP